MLMPKDIRLATLVVISLLLVSVLPSVASGQACELQGKQITYQFQGINWTLQLTVLGKKLLKHFEDRSLGHEYIMGKSIDVLADALQNPAIEFTAKRELGQGGGVRYLGFIIRADYDGRFLKLTNAVKYDSLFPGGASSGQTINMVEETVIQVNDCQTCQVSATERGEVLYQGRKIRPVMRDSRGVSCRIISPRR